MMKAYIFFLCELYASLLTTLAFFHSFVDSLDGWFFPKYKWGSSWVFCDEEAAKEEYEAAFKARGARSENGAPWLQKKIQGTEGFEG